MGAIFTSSNAAVGEQRDYPATEYVVGVNGHTFDYIAGIGGLPN